MYKVEAFKTGESFHRVATDTIPDDLLKNDNDDGHWFIPSIVNMALACELYMKSLASDGTKEIKGHPWTDLFGQIPETIQNEIYSSPYFKGDEAFKEKLEEGGKIYTTWRYHFEKELHPSVNLVFLEQFALVLHDLAERECKKSIRYFDPI